MTDSETLEKRGLWLSIIGALFMAGLGIGFAILTASSAVLLDGLFSLIGFAIGLVSLRVATLVRRPDDKLYHFGYAAYEPMLNLSKGLMMAFVTIFALVSAIVVVLHGGREIEAGWRPSTRGSRRWGALRSRFPSEGSRVERVLRFWPLIRRTGSSTDSCQWRSASPSSWRC